MKLRQAKKLISTHVKYGVIPHSSGRWSYAPAFWAVRESTKERAFRRLLRIGEGPWAYVDDYYDEDEQDEHGYDCDCDECRLDNAMDECGRLPPHLGGGCQLAGSEYCDFDCPFRDSDPYEDDEA